MKPEIWLDPDALWTCGNVQLLSKHFRIITFGDGFPWDSLKAVCVSPTNYVDSRLMDKCLNLKVIASNCTSDSHIDVELAKEKGIKVITLKDEQDFLHTITSTAEHTFGLILALTRNLIPAAQSVVDGNWDRYPFGGEKMLSRTTLGIVGVGRLGSMVLDRAKAFRMWDVSWYDPYSDAYFHDDVLLEDLVAYSDIITLHVPLTDETRNMVNMELLSHFKQGSYLINTSRGEVVDTKALLYFLKNGHLAGAALDVVAGEPEIPVELLDYALHNDNLIITPHIGGSTKDAWHLTQRRVIEKLIEEFENV